MNKHLNNKKIKIYFFLTTIIFCSKIYGQLGEEIFTKLPGVKTTEDFMLNPSLSNFTDYSNENLVDLYTGMVDINIPIYEVQDRDLSVPITLKYQRSGIKVNDESGWVGLGWNIVGGGYITREVRGNPDETITAISPSTGTEYIENFGRFYDLIDIENFGEEFPLGNTGIHSMDFYVDLLKSNTLLDCETIRTPFDSTGQENCQFACQYALVNALGQNPTAIGLRTNTPFPPHPSANHQVIFWNKTRDTQPDIFKYAVSGASGSFILDENGEAVLISGTTDVIIKAGIGPLANPNGWEIITSNGVIHQFPTTEEYTEVSKRSALEPHDGDILAFLGYTDQSLSKNDFKAFPTVFEADFFDILRKNENRVVNTWYLHKIKSSKYDSEITFTYESQGDIEEYYFTENKFDYVHTKSKTYNEPSRLFDCSQIENSYSTNSIQSVDQNSFFNRETNVRLVTSNLGESRFFPQLSTVESPKSLSKISFSKGEVNFVLDQTERFDMPLNYALDKINVKDLNNKMIKEFKFNYSAFYEEPYINVSTSLRLQLESFEEISGGLEDTKKYSFEYNTTRLPNQYSNAQDYWGYYNNNTQNSLVPNGNRFGINFSGVNRTPNEGRMKAWMLKKIIYPTGGSNELFYEINKYRDKEFNLEQSIGGLRVWKIITRDGTSSNNDIVKQYNYEVSTNISSGRTVHFLDRNWWRFFQNDAKYSEYSISNNTLLDHYFIKRSSTPIFSYEYTKGSLVGYQKVTVSQSGNGKTTYSFSSPEDYPNEEGEKIKYPFQNQNGSDLYHDNSHTSYDALRGLIEKIEIYDSNNVLKQRESFTYELNPENYQQREINSLVLEKDYVSNLLLGVEGSFWPSWAGEGHFLMDYTSIKSFFPYVKERKLEVLSDDNTNYVETFYENEKESSQHMQTTQIQVKENLTTPLRTEKYYYPTDDHAKVGLTTEQINALELMESQNRIESVLVESFIEDQITSRNRNIYDVITGNRAIIKSNEYSKADDNFIITNEYTYDFTSGNIQQVLPKDGSPTTYIFGYNKNYPIAVAQGVSYSELSSYVSNLQTISNADDDRTIGNIGNEGNLRQALEAFRLAFPQALITAYTYDPLIGVTSMTDSRGYTMYYQYDEFNRLKYIKDGNGKIYSKNEYNYGDNN
ncbi:hypothetical protein [uncultured Dokdonia sp.]|uniref:hypothetical protein n=1 Tax=uncultured Dokdonia sp. TaxID=575653 RepID=UPI00260D5E3E|nr:hypothetical protein [uncultured Dokdonia sp.]